MTNIISLTGDDPIGNDEPDPMVVAFIEAILHRAKRGEIRSIFVAFVRGNGRPSETIHFGQDLSTVYALQSAMVCGLHRLTDYLNGSATESSLVDEDDEE